MEEVQDLGEGRPRSESQFSRYVTYCNLPNLSLSFSVCKMGMPLLTVGIKSAHQYIISSLLERHVV